MHIKIGTRGSRLALIQAEYVKNRLKEKYPDNSYETVVIKTKGDIITQKPLRSIGGAGVFVREIEERLKAGEIDMAVHSMKDMPACIADGLVFSRLWAREDVRDALVINTDKNVGAKSFYELKPDSVIGTGSIRRQAMLKALRGDIRVVDIRGNVDTRLEKMKSEGLDGIVLAAAGLKRLGMENVISYYFEESEMIPAPAQGILALECREGDYLIKEMLDALSDSKTDMEGSCERTFLREMGADCHTPVGACCKLAKDNLGMTLSVYYGAVEKNKSARAIVSGENYEALPLLACREIRKQLAGKVWLVGAGPGDIGLLTLKGREILEKADCVVYDRLVNEEILELCSMSCEKIYVGKENRHHTMEQEDINRLLIKKSMEYDNVVRLKGGDSYVFGRGGEEGLALVKAGVAFEAVPGVTSAVAAPECANIPVTHRGISDGIRIVTAHNKNDEPLEADFDSMARGRETLVFMMGLSRLDEICKGLMKSGMDKETPAAVISNASAKKQRTVTGTIFNITERVRKTPEIASPAVIVVGNTVKLRDKLNYENNEYGYNTLCPKYIVPKTKKEKSALSELIRKKGGNPIEIQLGSIENVEVSIDKGLLQDKELIIFTSANGVNGFFEGLYKSGLDARNLCGCKIAAVGKKTAECLKSFGIAADIIPEKYNSDALLKIIKENIASYKNILYVKEKNVRNSLTEQLSEHANLTCLDVYENKKIIVGQQERQRIIKEAAKADGIMFTCVSNIERFFEITGAEGIKILAGKKIISIGEKCSSALEKMGITNYVQAKEASYEEMVNSAKKSC